MTTWMRVSVLAAVAYLAATAQMTTSAEARQCYQRKCERLDRFSQMHCTTVAVRCPVEKLKQANPRTAKAPSHSVLKARNPATVPRVPH
jgi:hypothetical protein